MKPPPDKPVPVPTEASPPPRPLPEPRPMPRAGTLPVSKDELPRPPRPKESPPTSQNES
uniref:Candidate secreted effector n=1 Tax=Meloidogyne incognita TaxID=6306 RepID=A0A914M074_MELIC